MADVVEINNAEGATRDTQPVHVNLVVRWQINTNSDKSMLHIYKELSQTGDLDQYVSTASNEAWKAVTAKYDATELISKRSEVSKDVVNSIQDKVNKYGISVLNVDMTSFKFNQKYMDAINAKVTEEQQKLAEQKTNWNVSRFRRRRVVEASARAEASIAEAKGKAEAVRLEAQALRDNMSILELRRSEVEKTKAEKWDGKLPTTVMGEGYPDDQSCK